MYVIGIICPKHPEFEGQRYATNHGCVKCAREKARARQLSHPEWRAEVVARSNQVHSARKRAAWAKWRADKIQRTPPWADLDKIKEIYREAKAKGLTVDHKIPLQGELVSGLHVHDNLQLLPAGENSSKGNKFEVI